MRQVESLTSKMIQKILATREEVGSLKKNDRNGDIGGFAFVSIDDYYDKVATAAHANGLYWTISQEELDVSESGAMFLRYVVDLYDYEEETVFERGWTATIPHPNQGAQTAGAAQSYADKGYMRALFKLVTGEPDSDKLAKKSQRDAPPPRLPKKQPEMRLEDAVATAGSEADIYRIMKERQAELEEIKKTSPKRHQALCELADAQCDKFREAADTEEGDEE